MAFEVWAWSVAFLLNSDNVACCQLSFSSRSKTNMCLLMKQFCNACCSIFKNISGCTCILCSDSSSIAQILFPGVDAHLSPILPLFCTIMYNLDHNQELLSYVLADNNKRHIIHQGQVHQRRKLIIFDNLTDMVQTIPRFGRSYYEEYTLFTTIFVTSQNGRVRP